MKLFLTFALVAVVLSSATAKPFFSIGSLVSGLTKGFSNAVDTALEVGKSVNNAAAQGVQVGLDSIGNVVGSSINHAQKASDTVFDTIRYVSGVNNNDQSKSSPSVSESSSSQASSSQSSSSQASSSQALSSQSSSSQSGSAYGSGFNFIGNGISRLSQGINRGLNAALSAGQSVNNAVSQVVESGVETLGNVVGAKLDLGQKVVDSAFDIARSVAGVNTDESGNQVLEEDEESDLDLNQQSSNSQSSQQNGQQVSEEKSQAAESEDQEESSSSNSQQSSNSQSSQQSANSEVEQSVDQVTEAAEQSTEATTVSVNEEAVSS